MLFKNAKELKVALVKYSVAKRFEYRFCKNTSTMVRARCKKGGCIWHIYASYDKKTKSFKLKTFEGLIIAKITTRIRR